MTDLVLLHGALGSKVQLEQLKTLLQPHFTVHTLNFQGHGDLVSDEPFSIRLFVQNVLDYLNKNDIQTCAIFGYSMGGYVALKLAQEHPTRVDRIVTLATKFAWSPEIATKETALLNPAKIEEKVPKFAAALAQLHTDWKTVMVQTASCMTDLGNQPALTETDFHEITIPVSLLLGSEDSMVTREETQAVAQHLPDSYVELIDGWQHPIERINKDELAIILNRLLR